MFLIQLLFIAERVKAQRVKSLAVGRGRGWRDSGDERREERRVGEVWGGKEREEGKGSHTQRYPSNLCSKGLCRTPLK